MRASKIHDNCAKKFNENTIYLVLIYHPKT